MKKLQVLAAAAVLGAMSMAAQADSSVSAQYSMIDLDQAGVTPAAIEISYGMGVAENISAEAYVGFGMGDDDGVEVSLTYGLEGIYSYGINDQFSVQGMLSFNQVEIEAGPFEDDDSGIGFGIGGSYALEPGSIFVQYRDLGELMDVDVTSIDIGYKHNL